MPVTQQPPGGLGDAISPEQWAAFVLERIGHASVVLRAGARRVSTTASVLHIPRIQEAGADWYSELDPLDDNSPPGDEMVLTMRKVANTAILSNEVMRDASASSINSIGDELLKAIGLAIDRAILVGPGGKAPLGIVPRITQQIQGGVDDYDNIVDGIGLITQHGGEPDSLFLNPADWTRWLKQKDAVERPIVAPDVQVRATYRLVGLAVYPTPALAAGTAVIAEAAQIVFASRKDASVEMSSDALFLSDGTAARVIARCDVDVNDFNGLSRIVPAPRASGGQKAEEKAPAPARKR